MQEILYEQIPHLKDKYWVIGMNYEGYELIYTFIGDAKEIDKFYTFERYYTVDVKADLVPALEKNVKENPTGLFLAFDKKNVPVVLYGDKLADERLDLTGYRFYRIKN